MKFWHVASLALGLSAAAALGASRAAELYAPTGYVWAERLQADGRTVELRLVNKGGGDTEVFFTFDGKTGAMLDENGLDKKAKLVVPRPGRRLWEPHPGQARSLEKDFVAALENAGYGPFRFRAARKVDGEMRYSDIADYLEAARKQTSKRDFAAVKTDIEANLSEARGRAKELLNKKMEISPEAALPPFGNLSAENLERTKKALVRWLVDDVYAFWDVAEVITGKNIDDGTNVNGFGRIAVEALEKYGSRFPKAIEDLVVARQCPLQFVLYQRDQPRGLRLAMLALLTHNHLSEFYYLDALLALYGPDKAWRAYNALNAAYVLDRVCWIAGKGSYDLQHDPEALKELYPVPEGDFTQAGAQHWVVMKDKHESEAVKLPLKKIYHYYGAIVLAARMKEKLRGKGVPDWLIRQLPIESAATSAGTTYKWVTAGEQSPEFELMARLYRTGAKHGMWLE